MPLTLWAKSAENLYQVDKQESQLSQRGRATLRVVGKFAKSLKVT